MGEKLFKDPIYGYITIDENIVKNIIDTPAFQRLKDIQQTSYTPLFPAAYHNRYIHSIGVYYLGQKAFKAITPQLEKFSDGTSINGKIAEIQRVFEVACLLHDIGHAPFSHTGELLYLQPDNGATLYNVLKTSVNEACFKRDVEIREKTAAAHEIMSCIVGLAKFGDYVPTPEYKSFFARCITGFEYTKTGKIFQLLNCVVSLLNSSVIDVDRLDYITRDAQTIGYKNVQIDYERLISGMRILEYQGKYRIGYNKSAISILENAVYAHDSEKKWIQNHPSILYETYILKHAMEAISKKIKTEEDKNPLFCYEALTEEGKDIEIHTEDRENIFASCKIRLLADEEILFLLKNFCGDPFSNEYFARDTRRTAVWKSEAEYTALFDLMMGDHSELIRTMENGFTKLESFILDKLEIPIINSDIYPIINNERERIEEKFSSGTIKREDYDGLKSVNSQIEKWVRALDQAAQENQIGFDFVLISAKKFNSNFKENIAKLPIEFPSLDKTIELGRVSPTLKATPAPRSHFFHLYYKNSHEEGASQKTKIIKGIAKALQICAVELSGEMQ